MINPVTDHKITVEPSVWVSPGHSSKWGAQHLATCSCGWKSEGSERFVRAQGYMHVQKIYNERNPTTTYTRSRRVPRAADQAGWQEV